MRERERENEKRKRERKNGRNKSDKNGTFGQWKDLDELTNTMTIQTMECK